jgi:hypothetical protein
MYTQCREQYLERCNLVSPDMPQTGPPMDHQQSTLRLWVDINIFYKTITSQAMHMTLAPQGKNSLMTISLVSPVARLGALHVAELKTTFEGSTACTSPDSNISATVAARRGIARRTLDPRWMVVEDDGC